MALCMMTVGAEAKCGRELTGGWAGGVDDYLCRLLPYYSSTWDCFAVSCGRWWDLLPATRLIAIVECSATNKHG